MLAHQTILEDWLSQLFTAAGCPTDEAQLIAIHLVDADASGHPSHGIVRVPRYMDYIQQQKVRTVCTYTTLMSSGSLRLFDGQYSFGQVLGHHVVREACEIVQSEGLALIGLRHAGHLGRIGGWAELLADQGFGVSSLGKTAAVLVLLVVFCPSHRAATPRCSARCTSRQGRD